MPEIQHTTTMQTRSGAKQGVKRPHQKPIKEEEISRDLSSEGSDEEEVEEIPSQKSKPNPESPSTSPSVIMEVAPAASCLTSNEVQNPNSNIGTENEINNGNYQQHLESLVENISEIKSETGALKEQFGELELKHVALESFMNEKFKNYEMKLKQTETKLMKTEKELQNTNEELEKRVKELHKCHELIKSANNQISELKKAQQGTNDQLNEIMEIVKPPKTSNLSLTGADANRKGFHTSLHVDLLNTETAYESLTEKIIHAITSSAKSDNFHLTVNPKTNTDEITENVVIFPKYCGSSRFQNAAALTLAQQGKKIVFLLYRYGNTSELLLGSEFTNCFKYEFKIKNLNEKLLDEANLDTNCERIATFLKSNARSEAMQPVTQSKK